MSKTPKTTRQSSIDGFIPRSKGLGSVDGSGKRRTLNDFSRKRSSQGIEFHDTWSKEDDSVLTIDPSAQSTRTVPKDAPKKKRRRLWPFKSRAEKGKPPLTKKQKIRRGALIAGALLLLLGGFLAWKFIFNAGKVFDGNIFGLFDNTKLRGEDEGRVNILLAGTSEDDPGHQGADLTDSIMIASIDVKNNTAFTVSLPRDLWVDYGRACASGYQGKINVVYQCGKDVKFSEPGYPEGGMGLLSKTVTEVTGLKMHYYGKLNYTAFKQAVDAVGGIEVTIDSDDPRGVYDPNIAPVDGGPLKLANGTQKINGSTALALARSRNSAGGYGMARGDFDRTAYQQQMLVALKDKALSTGTLINPAKIGGLLDTAGKNVKTDFKTNELRRLYDISKLINSNKIEQIDLASEDVNLLTTGSLAGQSIVQPVAGVSDFTEIKRYFKKITSNNPAIREDASIVVLNGSGVVGLAQKRADALSAKDLSVIAVANASGNREKTVIIDKTKGKKAGTKKMLEDAFGVSATTAVEKFVDAANYNADFVVIVGTKSASPSSTN